MNSIFARQITVLYKHGGRRDFTNVTEFCVDNPLPRRHDWEPVIKIIGEVNDLLKGRCNTEDIIPIKNIHMTIIDWYVPTE